jgi:hypothetical protein
MALLLGIGSLPPSPSIPQALPDQGRQIIGAIPTTPFPFKLFQPCQPRIPVLSMFEQNFRNRSRHTTAVVEILT